VLAETRFRAMGSSAHVLVDDTDPALLAHARQRLEQLEDRWSRFRPDSELCRLNAAAGRPVQVSADTAHIVRRSVEAWQVTGGLFDPTVLPAVEAAGYDRSFEHVRSGADPHTPTKDSGAHARPPGCEGIEVEAGHVRLPAGVRLDLGGIGKGYAADVVAHELRQLGAPGVCVNLGGDVRVSGPSSGGRAWTIGVDDPLTPMLDATAVRLEEGAVATSSRLRRRWWRDRRELHHLIDPRTGEPSRSRLVAVTVLAAQAHWAEIFAKAVLIAGEDAGAELLGRHGLSGLLTTCTGDVVRVGPFEEYEGWKRSSGGTSPARVG
jgi:thiamine biosynthesis lipoprotein